MSDFMIGLSGLGAMFILMILRMPVGMAMLAVGYFGTLILNGDRSANALLVTETFSATSNYSLTVVPLFILMGFLLQHAGVAQALLRELSAGLRGVPGGLGVAVVLVGGVLAASTGVVGASVATLTVIALPSLLRAGYGERRAGGLGKGIEIGERAEAADGLQAAALRAQKGRAQPVKAERAKCIIVELDPVYGEGDVESGKRQSSFVLQRKNQRHQMGNA